MIKYLNDVITKFHSSSVSMTARSPPCDWQFALLVAQLAFGAVDIQ